MENLKYPHHDNENIERKYLNNTRINRLLKLKNRLSELENDFIELNDRQLKKKSTFWTNLFVSK